jgi:putative ABC transport system substrate-binding protein
MTSAEEPLVVAEAAAVVGGLIVAPAFGNRQMIADIAVRLHLPAVYSYRFFVTSGDLASYSIDGRDLWRAAATYVDRILCGEKPGDLPAHIPEKLLVNADELIE